MAKQKILTLHPQGKKGVNIEKDKYDVIKKTITDILKKDKECGFMDLNQKVQDKLKGKFEGSIGWYYATIKLDLEARKIITCSRGTSGPQMIKLKK